MRTPASLLRHRVAVLAALLAPLALGACKSMGDVTGSIGAPSTTIPRDGAGLRAYAEDWGRRYDARPGDKATALAYARALRATTQYQQAVAVLQNTAIRNPSDPEVLGAYGKALSDAGRLQEAAEVLSRAHTPERPNWSILSAQGSVADQLGDHQAAQDYYNAALKIVPGEPSVLSNLGLSYALSKQLQPAEDTLREAVNQPRADGRVRQNLALVLALRGKFGEAQTIEQAEMSPADAAANVTAIRQMIAQSDTWRSIQSLDTKPASGRKGAATAAR